MSNKVIDFLNNRDYMTGDRSFERLRETSEIFTPTWLVNRILDRVPQDDFKDPDKTFLDPSCGDGQFLGQILVRKIKAGISHEQALKTLFGVDLMPDNVEYCRSYLLAGEEQYRHIVEKNIVCADALKVTNWNFNGKSPYHSKFDDLFE